jgi:hypothetical protein
MKKYNKKETAVSCCWSDVWGIIGKGGYTALWVITKEEK